MLSASASATTATTNTACAKIHPDHCFHHSQCRFLVDNCLTHHCHFTPDAIANAATNPTPATHRPPKLPPTLHLCHINSCRCAAGVAFVFMPQRLK